MARPTFDRQVFSDASWWHWTVTVPLLAAHMAGYRWALPTAMALCLAVGVYFLVRIGSWRPYPVQVRFAYLGLLLAGTLRGFSWIHWVQLVGTTAMVTVGYCALIRSLSLLPFNRTETLTSSLVWRTFFIEPCVGGLAKWPTESPPTTACCTLRPATTSRTCSLRSSPLKQKEHRYASAHL